MKTETVPANELSLSPELLLVLREWNDTSDETRAASKARLDALGPEAFTMLSAFLRRRARRCRPWNISGIGGFPLAYALVCVGLYLHPGNHNPAFYPWLIAGLTCFSAAIVSMGVAEWNASNKQMRNAVQTLASCQESRSIGVLAELYWHGFCGVHNQRYQPQASMPNRRSRGNPREVLLALLDANGTQPLTLTTEEGRCLRRLLNRPDAELNAAVLRGLMAADDAKALKQARRLAARSRLWETREAAGDYIERFAPDDALVLRHREARMRQADSGLAPGKDGSHFNILSCVMWLGSRSASERQTAQSALRSMNASQLDQILQTFSPEPDGNKRVTQRAYALCMLIGAITIGALAYFLCLRSPYLDMEAIRLVTGACAVAGVAFGGIAGADINYRRRNRQRAERLGCEGGVFPEKQLLQTLAELDNPALLNTLLARLPSEHTLHTEQTVLRKSLLQALVHLLPRLTASDAGLLDTSQRAVLNQQLGKGRLALSDAWAGKDSAEAHKNFDLAILKAWEQVGDKDALPFVQKLATQAALTPAQKQVRAAAQECLPYLEERAQHQQTAQTLLRAAQMPTQAGDVLLRPATAQSAPVEAEQLLRAAE